MKPSSNLPTLIERYFSDRLMRQCTVSPNTIASYRDTFRMLFTFAQAQLRKPPSALALDDLDAPFISAFLENLEKRGAGIRTRNLRLTRDPVLLPLHIVRGAGLQRSYPTRARDTEQATRQACPPLISRSGAAACTTASSQARQAYLGRCVTITRNCAGITSRRCELASPITCMGIVRLDRHMDARQMGGNRRGWHGASRRAPGRPPGASCPPRLRLPQWLARYPRTPDEAVPDRASPNRPNCARCNWCSRCRRRSFCNNAWSRSAIAVSRSAITASRPSETALTVTRLSRKAGRGSAGPRPPLSPGVISLRVPRDGLPVRD
jgi:hypothetical protein